ncbi:MAG: Asp-tRNA(Asn)/Glu-tRNA(Gln) amidotransferase subunit GatA [Phycisphaeraceae bacterium]|nr:MAG: Asp-tRNA(Asn)/Glu-tRNA(Gln) amidotransferase subunit GatA [Phycisphaeraceae bacterium]
MELHDHTLIQLRDAIARREVSSEEAIRASLARIDSLDTGENGLNAFLEVFHDRALDDARAIDRRIAAEGAEAVGPLAGVPVAIKDNMCLDHGRTTCASRILENYESPYTATAVQRLIDAGAVIVGKTNLDEFAMGSSTEHSAFGPTLNPWDRARAPGGSSGGSAAAVAARMVPGALGSDTGGSIRQPAGLCGVVGVKPTYGRVSRYGLVAFASSLDQIGPFARNCADAALLMNVITGHDPLDSTSVDFEAPDHLTELERPLEGLRLGVPRLARSDQNHPEVARIFESAIEAYSGLGAEIVDIELPLMKSGVAAYYIVAPAEASSNLARYDGVRYGRRAEIGPNDDLVALYARSRAEGFGSEVQRRIMLGTFALSSGYYEAYYNTALKTRRLIKNEFDAVFADASGPRVHAVLTPSSPEPAFKLGAKLDDPLAMYLEDIYTVTANLAGVAGVSIPGGFVDLPGAPKGLPVGLQLLCPTFAEASMLRIARMFEKTGDWNSRAPEL